MKWIRPMSLVLIVISLIIVVPLASFAQKPIVLRWTQLVPERPEQGGAIIDQFFASEVEKRTDNRVKFEFFWSCSMGKPKEMISQVKSGIVDLASTPSGYYPSEFPLWTPPNNIPFLMETLEDAWQTHVLLPKESKTIQKEIADKGLKLLYHHTLGPYQIFATKPVVTFEDLNGLKVRSWGPDVPKALHAAGAVGVSIFPAEMYESLHRNVVDAALWPLAHGYIQRTHEVAPHVCMWNFGAFVGRGVWINLDTWNKLSKDVQNVMIEVVDETREFELKKWKEWTRQAREKLEAEGAIFHEIPAGERQKWIDALPDFTAQWVEQMEKNGLGDEAGQIRKHWLEIVSKY